MSDSADDLQHDLTQCLEVRHQYLKRIEKLEAAIHMVLPKLDQAVKWGRIQRDHEAAAERAETVKGLLEHALND